MRARLADELADRFFSCPLLACALRFRACIARQVENERVLGLRKRRANGDGSSAVLRSGEFKGRPKRGRVPEFPQCQTRLCALGAGIRRAFGDDVARAVRSGPRDLSRDRPPALVELGMAAVMAARGGGR